MLEIKKPEHTTVKPIIRQATLAEFIAYENEIKSNFESEVVD